MWVGYTGKMSPIIQEMRTNKNNITKIIDQSLETTLTHFFGSLQHRGMITFIYFFGIFVVFIIVLLVLFTWLLT